MAKRNVLSPPRGGVIIHLTMRQAKKVLKAINNDSVTDMDVADVYDLLKSELENKLVKKLKGV